MSTIQIVSMEERHLDELAEISQLCFAMPWSREGLAVELSCDTAHFWVAEKEGYCLGSAGMHAVCGEDRKSTRLNSSHEIPSRMPSSA